MSNPTARVYVDGFNLYRRLLSGQPHVKWLDLPALAARMMPGYDIDLVRYFTARLRPGMAMDPQTPLRQQIYLRALDLDPKVEVQFGNFRNDKRLMPVHPVTIDPATGKFRMVNVRKLEEKGSDVNLASRMIADAHANRANIYVMLSNDSDLVGPMNMLTHELGYSTGIICPMESARNSKDLVKTSPTFIANISKTDLEACQYPSILRDSVGAFHRPPAWAANPA
ncbi:MAG: NYN domain-containing protein [Rhodoglobus sp.]